MGTSVAGSSSCAASWPPHAAREREPWASLVSRVAQPPESSHLTAELRCCSVRQLGVMAAERSCALSIGARTRNGVPVGELRPARRRFASRDLLLETFRTAPAIDPDRFRADVDAVAGQDIEPVA